jgi:peptide/nickel transport system ATP-binding protein
VARQKRQAGGARSKLIAIAGQVSSPMSPPPGCAFGPRCPLHHEGCDSAMPELLDSHGGRRVRCIEARIDQEIEVAA